MGLAGAVGFGVGATGVTFVSLDIHPLDEFEETVANNIGLAIGIATLGGGLLLLLGAVRDPRPGSWWDRRRTAKTAAE